MKTRLDRLLTELGHIPSRRAARDAIEAGLVRVNGEVVTKPAAEFARDVSVEAEAVHPYVSRAALKLKHALEVFGVEVTGRVAIDIGASTGGFTEVLLEYGAAHVTAVEIGHGQLHARLIGHPKVTLLEQTDARNLTSGDVGAPPSLIVCDASFIGLEKVLAVPLSLAAPGAELVALFKPQFEVGPGHVGKGGIVKDEAASQQAEARVVDWLASRGWHVQGREPSPITGADGNREVLLYARRN